MTTEEKLYYLIIEYGKGNYTTKDFCELFSEYYFHEEHRLPEDTDNHFRQLAERCARFSDCKADLALENVYFSESDIINYLSKIPKEYKYKELDRVSINLSKAEALTLYDIAYKFNKSNHLSDANGEKQIFWIIENLLEEKLVDIFSENYYDIIKAARKTIVKECGKSEDSNLVSPVDPDTFSDFIAHSNLFTNTKKSLILYLENWFADNPTEFIENMSAELDTVLNQYHFHKQRISLDKNYNYDPPLDTITCVIRVTDEVDDIVVSYRTVFDRNIKIIDDTVF